MATGESPTQQRQRVRRQFDLPSDDVETLVAIGLPWETVLVAGTQWLFVHEWPTPSGLAPAKVTLGIRVVQGYPTAALDMIYVHPGIARISGGVIPALTDTIIDGRTFQQWSRHYSPQNPWRPDVDNIGTFLRLVDTWFERAAK
jgi:hypothetical protein